MLTNRNIGVLLQFYHIILYEELGQELVLYYLIIAVLVAQDISINDEISWGYLNSKE